jgi:hypothetical protein
MAHTTTDTEAAPDWLSRVEASLKPPTEIPFEFKDDGGSESKALGSSVAAGEENEEKGSPIEEAAPFAQMAKLRISHSSSSSQDEVSDVSGEETSAEDELVSAENDVVSTDQTIVNQAVANMSYHTRALQTNITSTPVWRPTPRSGEGGARIIRNRA